MDELTETLRRICLARCAACMTRSNCWRRSRSNRPTPAMAMDANVAARYELPIRIGNLSFKHHQIAAYRDARV
jgi:hypothetical protein